MLRCTCRFILRIAAILVALIIGSILADVIGPTFVREPDWQAINQRLLDEDIAVLDAFRRSQ